MKNGMIGDFGAPEQKELDEINKFTRRKFAADEVYVFSVVLCDNEVDRDFERFTDESLEKMAELFVGKTGIFDHSHKSENQCARIFSCKVETVDGKTNRLGEQYKRLFARAYMPKSDKSKELILEIDAGIKKEVSVGCSMAKSVCSICGEPAGVCSHRKGRHYRCGGKKQLCYFDLCEPVDAYEWSFVAVPAQPQAGVVKAFSGGVQDSEIIIGDLKKSVYGGEVVLSFDEAKALSERLDELKEAARSAGEFISKKKSEIIEMYLPGAGEAVADTFCKALDRLEPEELYKLYSEGCKAEDAAVPQLAVPAKKNKQSKEANSFFIV